MGALTKEYLTWKHLPPNTSELPRPPHSQPAETMVEPSSINYDFTTDVINIYSLDTSVHISHSAESKSPNINLVHTGYLRTSPDSPSLAFSLQTLELY